MYVRLVKVCSRMRCSGTREEHSRAQSTKRSATWVSPTKALFFSMRLEHFQPHFKRNFFACSTRASIGPLVQNEIDAAIFVLLRRRTKIWTRLCPVVDLGRIF